MSYKNILSQALTIRLMELYKDNTQEKTLEIISKEICETLNCEPIVFIQDKANILGKLQKIITILDTIKECNDMKKINIITKSLKDIDILMKDLVIENTIDDKIKL